MGPRAASLLAGLLSLSLVAAPALALEAGTDADRVGRGLAYLAALQGADGRWALTSQGYVGEVLAAADVDPKTWPSAERPAFAAFTPESGWCGSRPLQEQQDCLYKSTLRVVHAVGVSGYDPTRMDGFDGVARVRAGFVAGQFGDATYVNDDMWAILALRAAGVPVGDAMIQDAAERIRVARQSDGGWSERAIGAATSVDMTGAALVALRGAGEDLSTDAAAREYLAARRSATDKAYATSVGGRGNCQATAWALHAREALGMAPDLEAVAFLRSLQNDDGGFSIALSPRGPSNLFCTVEALVILGGERYPLRAYAPLALDAPPAHAGENATLRAPGFVHARWTFADDAFAGNPAIARFDAAGSYAYSVVAESDATRARGAGALTILSARPLVGTLPQNVSATRHANVTLDLRAASDPDGVVRIVEVDWGDGNVTRSDARLVSHAYPRPGVYGVQARALDDADVWSHPAQLAVAVTNRAPTAPATPTRIVADRVSGVALDVAASDPDGDPVRVRWSSDDASGEGRVRFVPTGLGERTLTVTVEDDLGANVTTRSIVEVLNLPPTLALRLPTSLRAGEALALVADSADADGPAPRVAWTIDAAPTTEAIVTLGPGAHVVRATATDADDATTSATASILVAEPERARVPPEIRGLDASLAEGELRVVFDVAPQNATSRVAWRSDAGSGEMTARSPMALPLLGATWASVTLVASHDGLDVTRSTPLLVAPLVSVEAASAEAQAPGVLVEARADEIDAPGAPLAQSGVSAARQETPPAPAWLAVALALLARRAGRARRA